MLENLVLLLALIAVSASAPVNASPKSHNTSYGESASSTSHVSNNRGSNSSSSSYLATVTPTNTNSYPYHVKFDRLPGAGLLSDMADCSRCGAGYVKLHPLYKKDEAWFRQHLCSCYRCKTSPHPWTHLAGVDVYVAEAYFRHHGLPPSLGLANGNSGVTEACSVAECEAWIAANPVLGPRKSGMDGSTASLHACYACQRDDLAWAQSEDGQRIFAKLSNIMLNITLAPSKQLAAAAEATSSQAAAWNATASRNTTSICNSCYINLHSIWRLGIRFLTHAEVSTCIRYLEAPDIYEDGTQVVMSKAATVFFKHTASKKDVAATLFESGAPVVPYSRCDLCIGWLAQQQHQCVKGLQQASHITGFLQLPNSGSCEHCSRCLSDESSEDAATALVRARVHYYMASMLFNSCLKRAETWLTQVEQFFWGSADQHAGSSAHTVDSANSGIGESTAASGGDVGQVHVLLNAQDLQYAHEFFDEAINEGMQGLNKRVISSVDSPVALGVFVVLLAVPVVSARQRQSPSRRRRRRMTLRQRLSSAVQGLCCLMCSAAQCFAARRCALLCKVAGCIGYFVLRWAALAYVPGVLASGHSLQQPELIAWIDDVVVAVICFWPFHRMQMPRALQERQRKTGSTADRQNSSKRGAAAAAPAASGTRLQQQQSLEAEHGKIKTLLLYVEDTPGWKQMRGDAIKDPLFGVVMQVALLLLACMCVFLLPLSKLLRLAVALVSCPWYGILAVSSWLYSSCCKAMSSKQDDGTMSAPAGVQQQQQQAARMCSQTNQAAHSSRSSKKKSRGDSSSSSNKPISRSSSCGSTCSSSSSKNKMMPPPQRSLQHLQELQLVSLTTTTAVLQCIRCQTHHHQQQQQQQHLHPPVLQLPR
jgi:hypothetical protein